jgi:hypothetical protein
VAIERSAYFIDQNSGDEQAVILYTDGSTAIWDRDGRRIGEAGDDRFDMYCQSVTMSGFQLNNNPDWTAPSDP